MADTDAPDITTTWTLRRGSASERTPRFHLDVAIDAQFVDPTRDEVRTALLQALDESLGVNTETVMSSTAFLDIDEPFPNHARWTVGELEQLRAWKAEAVPLLNTFERCHEALPQRHQAPLGHSKADAVLEFLISDSWVLRPQVD